MKLRHLVFFLGTVSAVGMLGCDGDFDSLTGSGHKDGPGDENGDGQKSEGLQCTDAPQGNSYVTFDGSKLEASRVNENVGVNRARVKPFTSLEKEFKRVIGVVPPSLKAASSSFDLPPVRWFGETQYSGVSLHAFSSIAFDGCLEYVKSKPSFSAAPTAETARAECSSLMRKAWSRTPSPEEIDGCATLATKDLADEKDVARRWAYTCTSVLSSNQFLTF